MDREGGGNWDSSSGLSGSWDLEEAPLVGDYLGDYNSSVEQGSITASVQCDQSLMVTVIRAAEARPIRTYYGIHSKMPDVNRVFTSPLPLRQRNCLPTLVEGKSE